MRKGEVILAVAAALFGLAGSAVLSEWMTFYPIGHPARTWIFGGMIVVWIISAIPIVVFLVRVFVPSGRQKALVNERLSQIADAGTWDWVYLMLTGARPQGIPDSIWHPLEQTGLFERDHTGPKGIIPEFKPHVEKWLKARSRRQLMFVADALIVLSVVGLIIGLVWRFQFPPFTITPVSSTSPGSMSAVSPPPTVPPTSLAPSPSVQRPIDLAREAVNPPPPPPKSSTLLDMQNRKIQLEAIKIEADKLIAEFEKRRDRIFKFWIGMNDTNRHDMRHYRTDYVEPFDKCLKDFERLIAATFSESVDLSAPPTTEPSLVTVPEIEKIKNVNDQWQYRLFYLRAGAAGSKISAFQSRLGTEADQINKAIAHSN